MTGSPIVNTVFNRLLDDFRIVRIEEHLQLTLVNPVVRGVVYVPYQSVGTANGILPAVFIDRMEVEQEGKSYCIARPLLAISKQPLSPSGEYQILIQKADEGTSTEPKKGYIAG